MELARDGWLVLVASATRSFAFGFLSVILGLYLAALGMSPGAIGATFTLALAGGAVMTIALAGVADRFGRRRVLVLSSCLMALAGAIFALAENRLLLGVAALFGSISPSGKEVGPFLPIEQAILPQTTSDARRTALFAYYNLVSSLAGALGALAVTIPEWLGFPALSGYRLLIWAYVGAALLLIALFASLSPAAEASPSVPPPGGVRSARSRSRAAVLKLSALFALDAFAGGFVVQGLTAYWFSVHYDVSAATLGWIFFAANLCSALSFLAAVPLARRIGLLNTMVFTHLPSNILLMLVPLMPTVELALATFVARHLLSQLDVPTRQSYAMAIVEREERSAAAGAMSVARNAGQGIAPFFAGWMLSAPALGLPFLVAGSLKVAYDLTLFALFRKIKPPEERLGEEPPA